MQTPAEQPHTISYIYQKTKPKNKYNAEERQSQREEQPLGWASVTNLVEVSVAFVRSELS